MPQTNQHEAASTFESGARQQRTGLLTEFLDFVKHNKKYWLLPVLLVILGLGLLVMLGGTAAAPFIYTLF